MRCRYVGETETKGRNYTSRYFSRCNQSDYVSRGRLTVTFAALENVETRTDRSYVVVPPSIYVQGGPTTSMPDCRFEFVHHRVTRVSTMFEIMATCTWCR